MPQLRTKTPSPLEQANLEQARRERERRAKATLPRTPLEWAKDYRRIDDATFTLDNHKPLEAIYLDDAPHVVIMKPAQVGCSELAVTKAMHALDCGAQYYGTHKSGLNVAYLFPTAVALRDFSKERLTGLQAESPYIRRMFAGGFDDVGFKQVRDSYLYLRGAYSVASLLSFPADVLILDERDRMEPSAVALAEKRLRASSVKRMMELSTPTLPGRGIHAAYLLSDQRQWLTACNKCADFVLLDFFRDVTADGAHYDVWQHAERTALSRASYAVACPHCKAPLDRCAPGEWRVTAESDTHGYHVPSLCFPMVSLRDIALAVTSSDPTQVTEAYRSDLGVPYEAAGSSVTDSMLDALAADEVPTGAYTATVLGVDVGSRFHFVVSSLCQGERVMREAGAVRTWEELDNVMKRYRVRLCVIDAAPELHATEAFSQRHAGKVLRARYNIQLPTLHDRIGEEKPGAKRKAGDIVQINRTAALDAAYARLSESADVWPRAVLNAPEVRAHLKAPTRVEVETKRGDVRADWVHVAPDHFYHAYSYCQIGVLLVPKAAETALYVGGRVGGWQPPR